MLWWLALKRPYNTQDLDINTALALKYTLCAV